MLRFVVGVGLLLVMGLSGFAADGNRLAYLDENNPWYPHRAFPKLITPQWVGDEGVECVVTLAIDDMRDPAKYEAYLRPILQRLKQIDGRAPVSIMTCNVKPDDPQLQTWLDEGLSLEVHTVDHPCPLLQGGDFVKAKSTYDRCVDLMNEIPGNKPVAFRMPCCDSLNTVSPRFFAEIFNKTTEKGNFLALSSSVFNIYTADDPEIPRELILDPDGREKFRKYIPKGLKRGEAVHNTFVNTIENYPYPYVINGLCWEFPCVVPSDWEAQFLQKPNNPDTVRDLKAALDITVAKQGVFNFVFHPHGWIKAEQVVELIDHAVAKHGKKVKFLTFQECSERLSKNLLGGNALRAGHGGGNGVRILDLNDDGYMDVVIANENQTSRRWSPETRSWSETELPWKLTDRRDEREHEVYSVRFTRFGGDGPLVATLPQSGEADRRPTTFRFDGERWARDSRMPQHQKLTSGGVVVAWPRENYRFLDLDRNGVDELFIPHWEYKENPAAKDEPQKASDQGVFRWSEADGEWRRLPFLLPDGTSFIRTFQRDRAWHQHDAGLRFVDLDEDGDLDIVFSNAERYGIWLFKDMESGWSIELLAGKRGERKPEEELPPIVRADGTDNGFFVHSRHLFWQNEDTAHLPDLVDRRAFDDLLKGVQPGAKSPEASLRSMRPRPGFTVELVAAEPLVKDPVALDWGPDGKLWVAEMADYPLGIDGKGMPGGRVRFLEDTDGDGKYDKSTLFLEGVPFPNGVMAWRKGVLVSAAPDIFYAEDTDGDGKADRREVLFTGFGEGNQQHRMNGFAWGLDGWVYCANGDSDGAVQSMKRPELKVDIRGRDFRIRPDTGEIEPQPGRTQFGRNRDDWGNWFGCNNSNPMFHFVLADEYLRRNPHFAPPDPRVHVPSVPGAAPIFPVSRTLERFNDFDKANRITSACSVMVYRDDLFGPAFAGNSFVSEPVHNLVHREVLSPKGVTFTSRRADDEQESEFLASTDNWFRPTQIKTGPDGALWVADMYRHVIEHPQWIPQDWQQRLNLRAGEDRGRIYRVFPIGTKPRAIPRLDTLTTGQLVAALDSPSGWQRDTAQRMLLERKDRAAVPGLARMVKESKRPLARLQALCTLEGLDALTTEVVVAALADEHPGVRRHAVRVGEVAIGEGRGGAGKNQGADAPRSPKSAGLDAEAVGAALLKLVDDDDPHVQMQLAYTLGEWRDERAARALGTLAVRQARDPYRLAAVMSSVRKENVAAVLAAALAEEGFASSRDRVLGPLLQIAAATGEPGALASALAVLVKPGPGSERAVQFRALARVLDAANTEAALRELESKNDPRLKQSLTALSTALVRARDVAFDGGAPEADRIAAVPLVGRHGANGRDDLARLAELLVPQSPPALQAAVIERIGAAAKGDTTKRLLPAWKTLSPALRSQALDALLSRDPSGLLDALERKQILAADLSAAQRQQLLRQKSSELSQRAARLLDAGRDPDRGKVLGQYRPALAGAGDAARGKLLFGKTCAACHKVDGTGHEVGPDLAALKDTSSESLLVAILDPNRAVESKFLSYIAVTDDGRTLTGMLSSETATSLTLLAAEGKQQTLLRTEIEELASTSKSMMPEGLEKDLKSEDVRDLIAWLQTVGRKRTPKTFAGNTPSVVAANADGSLTLSPAAAEIFGPSIVLEAKYGNLGYWSSDEDEAVWTIDVAAAGMYDVTVEWAVPTETNGNAIRFSAGGESLTAAVPATGSWDTYRRASFGKLVLQAGKQRLAVRSEGKIRGALIDLKGITLTPVEGCCGER